MTLLAVADAQAAILERMTTLASESIELTTALGRVLAAPIYADRDAPPFANSAMDGYAVLVADLNTASADNPVALQIIERVAAGAVPQQQLRAGSAIRIMTGAQVPANAEAVVPFEETDEGQANAQTEVVRMFQPTQHGNNIRPAGEDMQAGSLVLAAGQVINPGSMGVLATIGASQVPVFRQPRVAIIATGDELVDVGVEPKAGQIRNSNGYANAAQVREAGAIPIMLPIVPDNAAALRATLAQAVAQADVLLTSGGVSVGDYDLVKQILNEVGKLEFWRVRMRPGKPLAFGSIDGKPIFGLPGNPVSAMVCFELFVRPALRKIGGYQQLLRPSVWAKLLDADLESNERRQYLRVIVKSSATGLTAELTGAQGSGLVSSMARANGLLIVPEAGQGINRGEMAEVVLFGELH
ncbi:MAG: molybdopterin molybdotransferase MoeA [Chloroflexi bacterium]|nr:molybdopterin molybdotransferase MoeA [Chloroflexota bacterium]